MICSPIRVLGYNEEIKLSFLLRIGYKANGIIELGILGLNEDFVQLNEIMTR